MAKKPLSNIDHAWLRMDQPENLMIITGLMTFGAPLDMERLKAVIQDRLLRFDRFRQRVVHPWPAFRRPHWQEDPAFDLDSHVETVTLSEPGDQRTLQDLVSMVMSFELDNTRPLWHFYVVEKYGEGSALICRLHHSLADGIALMKVLLSMADSDPDASWPAYEPEPPTTEEKTSWLEGQMLRARRRRGKRRQALLKIGKSGARLVSDREYAREQAQLAAGTALAAGRLALRWPDPRTIFKGPLSMKKRAAWSEPFPLDDVKAIGRKFGATVNDVLLGAVTGALRRYMQEQGEDVDQLDIRGVIPVNLRPVEIDDSLGNEFGLVFLTLPVSSGDHTRRLRRLKQNMDKLKDSYEAVAAMGLLAIFGAVPKRLEQIGVSIFDTKGSAVMTNVPGPREQLYLAGAPIETVMAWVPQSGRLSLGVSIVSYNGQVWLGVTTDEGIVPDPERIIEMFFDDFEAMASIEPEELEPETAVTDEDIQPIYARLSVALDDLDKLLTDLEGDRQEDRRASTSAPTDRCQALTKAGKPCKNRPLEGSQFCRVHH